MIKSPLQEIHEELGATFIDFLGFWMPLKYSSIKDEHLAVRKKVGIFDVSHMGNAWVRGKDVEEFLNRVITENPKKIKEGMGQYTVILREDGTIIDDTVFSHLKNGYLFVPNAGNEKKVSDWFKKQVGEMEVEIRDVSREYAIIAIQGPRSRETLQKSTPFDLTELGFFACKEIEVNGVKCIASHTGYTGELGFELQIPGDTNDAIDVYRSILDAGKEFGIKPIGLGARDTLRLEKCFALAGNEFEGGRTPLEAGLGWVINWDHDFIGKNALLKQKEKEYEKLTPLECIGKGIPRHGQIVEKDGEKVGMISSGSLSPCLERGIALAYMKPGYREIGMKLEILARRKIPAEVVKPPFVKKGEC